MSIFSKLFGGKSNKERLIKKVNTNSASKVQPSKTTVVTQYFPHHLDNEKYRQARLSKSGTQFVVLSLEMLISQMSAQYHEWQGLFSVSANGEVVEVKCLKGFEYKVTIQAIPCLWKRKSFLENCMLFGVEKIVFVDPIASTFDLLEVNKYNPANYS